MQNKKYVTTQILFVLVGMCHRPQAGNLEYGIKNVKVKVPRWPVLKVVFEIVNFHVGGMPVRR